MFRLNQRLYGKKGIYACVVFQNLSMLYRTMTISASAMPNAHTILEEEEEEEECTTLRKVNVLLVYAYYIKGIRSLPFCSQ